MIKYLGTFEVSNAWDDDAEDYVAAFYREGSEDPLLYPDGDTFPLDNFMRADKDSWFDGYMSETNTSSIVCKFNKSNDVAKLYRVW